MANENDGQVVYEVRADTSKLDSDLDAADRKVAQASEKTAKKQEDAQKDVVKSAKKANSDIAKDTEKTQQEVAETVKKESGKAAEHFGKSAEKMSQSGRKAAEEVENSVSGMASSIITKIGQVAAAAASVKTLVSTMKAAIGEAVAAETSFAKVNTLLSENADRTKYFDDIKNASKSTGVVVSDLSEAVYSALSASVDEDSAVDFTGSAVKLAKGGFTDTATAVDILTTAINAYNLKADDAVRVSDVLITTQNLGKTTVGELASSMGQTIPIANSAEAAIEDLAAQDAVMTKNGVATVESGTVQEMLQYVCKRRNIETDFQCLGYTVSEMPVKDESKDSADYERYYTYKEIIGFIAAAHGASAAIDSEGKLVFLSAKESKEDVNKSDCIDFALTSAEKFTVKGILLHVQNVLSTGSTNIFINDDSKTAYDGEISEGIVETSRLFGIIEIAEALWGQLGGFSYNSCEFTRRGRGWTELGDIVRAVDDLGEKINGEYINRSIIAQTVEWSFSAEGGFIEHIISKVENSAESAERLGSAIPPNYSMELLKCQRYYEVVVPASTIYNFPGFFSGEYRDGAPLYLFTVPMHGPKFNGMPYLSGFSSDNNCRVLAQNLSNGNILTVYPQFSVLCGKDLQDAWVRSGGVDGNVEIRYKKLDFMSK